MGVAGAGAIDLALNAATTDHVEPFQVNADGNEGEFPPEAIAASDPPREITGFTAHGEQQAQSRDGGTGVSDEAIADAVASPVRPVEEQAGGRYLFEGRDATVVLNEDGRVITTWAETRAGWRYG